MATEGEKIHAEALEDFEAAMEAAEKNHNCYKDDYRFARLEEQWPEDIRKARQTPGQQRPMLTMNVMPAFGRQVVNDIRQNRPQTKVRPVDSAADVTTAVVIQGLIKNIEHISNAAVAYDTAAECCVYGGFGFWRIDIDYAYDDSFDQDIVIKRVANPLSVLGDPYSTAADSSDWNVAFVCDLMSRKRFEASYPDADTTSFDSMDTKVRRNWMNGDDILVAEYWKREEVEKTILRLSDRTVMSADRYMAVRDILEASGLTVIGERKIKSHKVKQCLLNGSEVLTKRAVRQGGKESTRNSYDWPGRYIPIIPCYGDEINIEGERLFRSMIHSAIDAQKQLNYWETTATELVALAPRVPWVGEEEAFTDPNWATANTQNHPFLFHKKGTPAPQRQQIDQGPALGAITQARQARDNIKAILGMYDASIGNKSNETSGRAIQARQREGDVSQFHFSDNLMRAIRHSGIVIMDLIQNSGIYTAERIVRVLGEDGVAQNVRIGQREQQIMPGQGPAAAQQPQPGQDQEPPKIGALQGVFDLSMGKYDLVVEAGPSYTTQRQETAAQIGEFLRAFPQAAPVIGDILVGNFDWKDAPEISRRLKKMLPPNLQEGAQSPELIQAQQQIAALTQQIQAIGAELEAEKTQSAGDQAKANAAMAETALKQAQIDLDTKRLPTEEMIAREKLLMAQRDLLLAQAQVGAATAESQANAGAANGVTELAAAMAQAAQAIQVATQQLGGAVVAATAPKMKDVAMQRQPDGSYRAQVVERTVMPGNGAVQ